MYKNPVILGIQRVYGKRDINCGRYTSKPRLYTTKFQSLTLRHSIGTGILVTNPEVFHLSVSTSDHTNQARTVEISRNQRTLSPITQVFSTREQRELGAKRKKTSSAIKDRK
jgi:hypothetical protein